MEDNYQSSTINHLGLVAGISRELELVECIDAILPRESIDKIVSSGEGVLAMILNGLGFVNQRLYLTEKFFEDKPVARLISPHLESQHLNDDCLGRLLDSIYEYGCSRFYSKVISHCYPLLGLKNNMGHMDITNFHLHGSYLSQDPDGITISTGFSKDHRPDLVQASLLLITSNKGRIPLLMRPLSGNKEEGQAYEETLKNHIGQLETSTGFSFVVIDGKGYNQSILKEVAKNKSMRWLSRVPFRIGLVNDLIDCVELDQLLDLEEGYSYLPLCSLYAGVPQRWTLIHSTQLEAKQTKSITKQIEKELETKGKELKKLMKKRFRCLQDAEQALANFESSLKTIELSPNSKIEQSKRYLKRGKPTENTPFEWNYSIQASLQINEQVKEIKLKRAGFFVLATNELDQEVLGDAELLTEYKHQDGCEKGFRFMKDPNVVGSSLFLNKNTRIEALLTVMTLCLFVYTCLEYKIREKLEKNPEAFFKNQKGKPTRKPTAKWVFHCFVGIHLLIVNKENEIVLNLKRMHKKLLDLMGKQYWIYYS